MYNIDLWDKEKWNIHSDSYNPSKYGGILSDDKNEDKVYREQKYGAREKNISSDYMRSEENKERSEKDKGQIFNELEEDKNEKQSVEEDSLQFKAASQISEENKNTQKFDKKIFASIEEAIKKAVEEEKKVIIMNN